jgi:hypothetical protein
VRALKNRFFALSIIVIITSGIAFGNVSSGETQTSLVVSNPSVIGVYDNPVNVEYLSSDNSSSPIVLLIGGFLTNYSEYATLQFDLVNQGYVTVSVSETHVLSVTDLTTTKQNLPTDVSFDYNDIVALLNWIGNNSLGVGNKQNIVLIARSTGGCASLIYSYLSYGVKGICALSPAFNFTSAVKNLYPIFIITAQGDTIYEPNCLQYYQELVPPKAYIEFKNGTHNLGVIDSAEKTLPDSFTNVTEKYILAFLSYATQNAQDGYNTINSAITDPNILFSQSLLADPSSYNLPTISPSPSPISTPIIPEFPLTIVLMLLITGTLAVMVDYRRKAMRSKNELI